ncbi:MAG: hypothetical protein EB168_09450 [Euryarchaeota archaeon]|nr:hypothetical protein [Euryarchaeota archaeon]
MNSTLASDLLRTQNDLVIISRMCHWNVKGPDFFAYHLLFERVYNTVADRVDTTVEVLRGLGYMPTFKEFAGPGGALPGQNPAELVRLLLQVTTEYFTSLDALKKDEENNPVSTGLVNLLDELMQDCTVLLYLLSSSQ